MSDYSPCDIGDIVFWDKNARILRTSLGDLPYKDVQVHYGWDWVIVRLPDNKLAPVCVGMWENYESTHH